MSSNVALMGDDRAGEAVGCRKPRADKTRRLAPTRVHRTGRHRPDAALSRRRRVPHGDGPGAAGRQRRNDLVTNLAALLFDVARRLPDRPAVSDDRSSRTYRELTERVARLAGGLRAQGLAPGDRVLLSLENCGEFFELLFGCWAAGLCAVPANARLHPREVEFIAEDSGARLLVATPVLAEALAPLAGAVASLDRVVATRSADYDGLFGEPLGADPGQPTDSAWLFYTSGTTGRPKGAVLTHRNLAFMSQCYYADIDQLYGQGESPMTITGLAQRLHERDHPNWYDRLASCGYARSGVLVRVVDDQDRDLRAGEIGEVITKSDCVMDGYWQNPAANAETLRGGWLHTGDLGSMNADGLLTLRDRSKDMIISGGSNIYPREIEEVLLRHPDVVEASVVGRSHPDWGEEVVAFLVARRGTVVAAAELDRLCLDHVARFKRPRDYRFVEALPKNNYDKVLKTELRRLFQEGS